MVNTVKEIENIFNKFNDLKVMIIGDIMLDSYIWGKVERISPEAPVPVVSVKKKENRPGGAANVALNIKALGAKPLLCSVIGNDTAGHQFMEILDNSGLWCDGIVISDERITTTKSRIIGNNAQMLRIDQEMDNYLTDNEKKLLKQKIIKIFKDNTPDVIIFQDYNKGTLDSTLIKKIIDISTNFKIPIVVDPKQKNFNSFKNIQLFKPNLKELKDGLKNIDDNFDINTHSSIIQDFQRKQNIDILLLTLSEGGIYVSYKNNKENNFRSKHFAAHLRTIADVSGAGDTVISVAALCIALQLNPLFVAALSNLAGGLVCEKIGVVPVEKDLLLKESLLHCPDYLDNKIN